MNSEDDPEIKFLESKITASKALVLGSRSNLRYVTDCICSTLALKPRWRRGIISSFFDGANYKVDARNEALVLGVEVLFEDASVQIFSNRLALRNRDEMILRYLSLCQQ